MFIITWTYCIFNIIDVIITQLCPIIWHRFILIRIISDISCKLTILIYKEYLIAVRIYTSRLTWNSNCWCYIKILSLDFLNKKLCCNKSSKLIAMCLIHLIISYIIIHCRINKWWHFISCVCIRLICSLVHWFCHFKCINKKYIFFICKLLYSLNICIIFSILIIMMWRNISWWIKISSWYRCYKYRNSTLRLSNINILF